LRQWPDHTHTKIESKATETVVASILVHPKWKSKSTSKAVSFH